MPQGTVKWFFEQKGYGFISPDDGGKDLFVHHTGIAGGVFKGLESGAKVTYETTQGKKGIQAVNVIPRNATPVNEKCSSCGGSGMCAYCDGEGYVRYGSVMLGCRSCDQPYAHPDIPNEGNGRCGECHGTGVVPFKIQK